MASWSQLRIVLRSSDVQIWYGDLGNLSTAGLTPGQFNTVHFSGLAGLQNALSGGGYDDLSVEITVNGPAGNYYFDNMVFGGEATFDDSGTGSGTGGAATGGSSSAGGSGATGSGSTSSTTGGAGTDSTPGALTIRVPVGTTFNEVIFGAQSNGLDVHDSVQAISGARNPAVGLPGQSFATVTSVGSVKTTVGSNAWVGDVFSVPDVLVRSNGRVRGNVETEGSYENQWGGSYTGYLQEQANLEPFEETVFEYEFPTDLQQLDVVQNGAELTLTPGGYGPTAVQGWGSSLHLIGPGTFYFEDLLIESGTNWDIDNSQGAVFIVVRGKLRLRGTQTNDAASKQA